MVTIHKSKLKESFLCHFACRLRWLYTSELLPKLLSCHRSMRTQHQEFPSFCAISGQCGLNTRNSQGSALLLVDVVSTLEKLKHAGFALYLCHIAEGWYAQRIFSRYDGLTADYSKKGLSVGFH